MVRALLAKQRPDALGRVVLLGAPNGGSELADEDRHGALTTPFLENAGPSARALGTGPEDFAAQLPAPDYEVGVIAGTRVPAGRSVAAEAERRARERRERLEGADFRIYPVSHWRLRGDDVAAGGSLPARGPVRALNAAHGPRAARARGRDANQRSLPSGAWS